MRMKTIAQRTWDDEKGRHINDIYLLNGQIALCDGKERHAQVLASVIRTVRGELLLDAEEGLPYFATVFGVRQEKIMADAIRTAAERLPFVTGVKEFSYKVDERTHVFSYSLTVSTREGDVTVNG